MVSGDNRKAPPIISSRSFLWATLNAILALLHSSFHQGLMLPAWLLLILLFRAMLTHLLITFFILDRASLISQSPSLSELVISERIERTLSFPISLTNIFRFKARFIRIPNVGGYFNTSMNIILIIINFLFPKPTSNW